MYEEICSVGTSWQLVHNIIMDSVDVNVDVSASNRVKAFVMSNGERIKVVCSYLDMLVGID